MCLLFKITWKCFIHIETSPLPICSCGNWTWMVPYHAKLNLKGFGGGFLRTSSILRQTSGTTYSISDPYENTLFVNEKVKPKANENGLTYDLYNAFQKKKTGKHKPCSPHLSTYWYVCLSYSKTKNRWRVAPANHFRISFCNCCAGLFK